MLGFDGHIGDARPDVVVPGRSGPVYCSHFSTRVVIAALGVIPLGLLALGVVLAQSAAELVAWAIIAGLIAVPLAVLYWFCLSPGLGFDATGFRAPAIGLERLVEWHEVADLLIEPATKRRALYFRDGSSVMLPPGFPGVEELCVELNRRGIFAKPM